MLHLLPILLTLPAGTFVAPQDGAVDLRWKPSAGVVQHEWQTAHHLFLDSFVRSIGEEREVSELRWSIRTERRLTAVDDLRQVGPDHPLELRRDYRMGEMVARMEPIGNPDAPTSNFTLTSPLAGKSVVWTWVPSESKFGRYYDGPEGKENLLPGLREDLGLRALLPGKPVKVGETWPVDPQRLLDVLEPGGRLALDSEKGSRVLKRNLGAGVGGGLHRAFGGQNAGKVEARLDQVVDGAAQISVTFSRLRYLADLTDYVTEANLVREASLGLRMTGGRIMLELHGSGTLVWDLEAGRARSYVCKADEAVEMTLDSSAGDTVVVERMKMVGSYASSYSAGPAKK